MKKVLVSLCVAAALLCISSCGSTKEAATLADIQGEWNIIEINGGVVVPAPGQAFPFIGFDTEKGTINGNAGCNLLTGSFNIDMKPGTIDLSGMGSTRRMCPDMTVENNVLSALAQVKRYKKMGDRNIALCGSSNRPILVLQKKQ
ncbi:MAG: META domain-containing protein [Bacteroides sp.]|nr:META domain-containing protein [Bacteroides sp.]